MTKQIAVRLPEELVEFVDATVSSGAAGSRAAVVTRALERERRRTVAARDVELLQAAGEDGELVAFSVATAGLPSGLD